MVRRKTIAVVTAWILPLVVTGLWAQAEIQIRPGPDSRVIRPGDTIGPIITSTDIGFQRVASVNERGGTVTGRWMVRVNGEWLVAIGPTGMVQPVGR
jgi:hypothetical protein